MSADKFDKELASLYQQRKQQTNAPKVTLTSEVISITINGRSGFIWYHGADKSSWKNTYSW